jgi:hypothetical protein
MSTEMPGGSLPALSDPLEVLGYIQDWPGGCLLHDMPVRIKITNRKLATLDGNVTLLLDLKGT